MESADLYSHCLHTKNHCFVCYCFDADAVTHSHGGCVEKIEGYLSEGHSGYDIKVSFVKSLSVVIRCACVSSLGSREANIKIDGFGFSSIDVVILSPRGRHLGEGNSYNQKDGDEGSRANHGYLLIMTNSLLYGEYCCEWK